MSSQHYFGAPRARFFGRENAMLETLKIYLIAYFVGLSPVYYGESAGPESAEERAGRLAMAASTVADVAHDHETQLYTVDAIALVTAVWENESALEYYVHAGKRSPIGHQDNGRAKCLGQIHTWPGNTWMTRDEWKALAGLDRMSTARCAQMTLNYLWAHAKRCLRQDVPRERRWKAPLSDGEAARVFAAYGVGKCSEPKSTTRLRVRAWRRVRAQLRKAFR